MNDLVFWKWWTVVNAGIIALLIGAYFFDLIGFILQSDATYLSFVIMLVAIGSSVAVFFNFKYLRDPKNSTSHDVYWFASDAVLTLGMIGTVVGFLMVLGQAFLNIDPGSIESMTSAIEVLAVGMSTALTTTLVGLVSSLWLKLQLVILES